MVFTGFDKISESLPPLLKGKSLAVLCHAPSINRDFVHIIDFFRECRETSLKCIFGPQHGLFGQTQDNMIEWEGNSESAFGVPVYSLYGRHRTPAHHMLEGVDIVVVDLQDIGARPYTYIWTLKNVMKVCAELSLPVLVLDRPNPVSRLGCEGPVLKRDYFTFVGGAEIPLCHDLTIGEIAVWLNEYEDTACELHIEWMSGWKRGMMYRDTGLQWVPPSPNMPSQETAVVYPGMVLTEALNLSEARGTTTPFELFGAPALDTASIIEDLKARKLKGCAFRLHDFIPTFNKYSDNYCKGIQIHITDPGTYEPVFTAISLYDSIIRTNPLYMEFNKPPYEYEYRLMPFDILMGDSTTREALTKRENILIEKERWSSEVSDFQKKFSLIKHY